MSPQGNVTRAFVIVCPDGLVRNIPYAEHADAAADAEVFDARGGCYFLDTSLEYDGAPPCADRPHAVRAVMLVWPSTDPKTLN